MKSIICNYCKNKDATPFLFGLALCDSCMDKSDTIFKKKPTENDINRWCDDAQRVRDIRLEMKE